MSMRWVGLPFMAWCFQAANAFVIPQSHVSRIIALKRPINLAPIRGGAPDPRRVLDNQKRYNFSVRLDDVAATATTIANSLPGWRAVSLACILPSCLGYYKRVNGVMNYAFGTAISLSAWLVLKALPSKMCLPALHAAALLFYGIRLDFFLLFREMSVDSARQLRDKAEHNEAWKRNWRAPAALAFAHFYFCMTHAFQNKTTAKPGIVLRFLESAAWGGILLAARAPLLLSCAALYFCLTAPLLVTAQAGVTTKSLEAILKLLVGTTWFGFLLAAVGGSTKSWVKAREGDDKLVTSGLFKYCRHPNYTGEVIGWTSSALMAMMTATFGNGTLSLSFLSVCSLMGAWGITHVLFALTQQLELRQEEKYGKTEEYKNWIKSTWVGFQLNSEDEAIPPAEFLVNEILDAQAV